MVFRDDLGGELLVEHSPVYAPLVAVVHEPEVSVPARSAEGNPLPFVSMRNCRFLLTTHGALR